MAFSTGFGLPCMCFIMLLFLPAQGQHQCTTSKTPEVPTDCCTKISRYPINEPVAACYEQKKDTTDCKIHAYIFVTKTNEEFCVNPDAGWLPKRLEKLKKNGIICKPFWKAFANQNEDDAS